MSYTITKSPAFKQMPVGTDWIFSVTSSNISNYKFKFFVDVYFDIFGGQWRVRLKFSPNQYGAGVVNLSDIFEQYLNPTELGSTYPGIESSFKGVNNVDGLSCPIHAIDKASLNNFNMCKGTLGWGEEYSTNSTDAPTEYPFMEFTTGLLAWNGMAYNNEPKRTALGTYGISLVDWDGKDFIPNDYYKCFLTNASGYGPYGTSVTRRPQNGGQLLRQGDGVNTFGDYHTLAYLNGAFDEGNSFADEVYFYFMDAGGYFINSFTWDLNAANGAYAPAFTTYIADGRHGLQYIGVGPANIVQAGGTIPAFTNSYLVYLQKNGAISSEPMAFWLQDNPMPSSTVDGDCKGYERIRLAWLNKFGVWDYYNFTKKNIRSTAIKRTHFNQVKGDWNSQYFTKDGYNRGLTTLNTNLTEKITLNSDWFNNDVEAEWMEELFISPLVYILEDATNPADGNPPGYGDFVTPVQITNKEYIRYTRANDKVAQYEVDIEYSINKRVQRA
tara:strand:- start:6735 stop:8228 length:1494 start_codon:yes stop_codon:yes gene_type:complete